MKKNLVDFKVQIWLLILESFDLMIEWLNN